MKNILLTFLFISVYAMGSFQLAPPIQEIDLKARRSGELYVINETDKPIRIKIYAKKPADQKNEQLYLGEWMVIYPQLLYLKPKSKRSVRYGMRVPNGIEDGEYRGEIVFEQLPSKNLNFGSLGERAEDESHVGVEMLSKIISTVYGNYGEIKIEADTAEFKIKSLNSEKTLEGILVNKGTGAIDPLFIISYINGKNKKIEEIEVEWPKVMRNNQSEFTYTLEGVPANAQKIFVELYHRTGDDEDDERIKLKEMELRI